MSLEASYGRRILRALRSSTVRRGIDSMCAFRSGFGDFVNVCYWADMLISRHRRSFTSFAGPPLTLSRPLRHPSFDPPTRPKAAFRLCPFLPSLMPLSWKLFNFELTFHVQATIYSASALYDRLLKLRTSLRHQGLIILWCSECFYDTREVFISPLSCDLCNGNAGTCC